MRRATRIVYVLFFLIQISIHALREEGDVGTLATPGVDLISIHALREEGDGKRGRGCD